MLAVLVHLVNSSCPRDILAVYKIRLETFWSEERFPKQYPQWRPPAQWSKTVGLLDFFSIFDYNSWIMSFFRFHPPSRVSALRGMMALTNSKTVKIKQPPPHALLGQMDTRKLINPGNKDYLTAGQLELVN